MNVAKLVSYRRRDLITAYDTIDGYTLAKTDMMNVLCMFMRCWSSALYVGEIWGWWCILQNCKTHQLDSTSAFFQKTCKKDEEITSAYKWSTLNLPSPIGQGKIPKFSPRCSKHKCNWCASKGSWPWSREYSSCGPNLCYWRNVPLVFNLLWGWVWVKWYIVQWYGLKVVCVNDNVHNNLT